MPRPMLLPTTPLVPGRTIWLAFCVAATDAELVALQVGEGTHPDPDTAAHMCPPTKASAPPSDPLRSS
jgi:hypothetical protein